MILVAVVLLALLVLIALVADGGVLLAAHRDLQGTADGAARAGAGALDLAAYRASDGRIAQLDPALARSAATRFLAARRRSRTPRTIFTQAIRVPSANGSCQRNSHPRRHHLWQPPSRRRRRLRRQPTGRVPALRVLRPMSTARESTSTSFAPTTRRT